MKTAEQLKAAVEKKGYRWFTDRPNIIGIRETDPADNTFNDEINVEWRGRVVSAVCTTDPGKYYMLHPCNPKGCGMLVPGQYLDCWKLGLHNNKYIALVQVGNMKAYRDDDKDGQFMINPSTIETGMFGCNLHHAFNTEVGGMGFSVDNWSAMCQVILHINQYKDIFSMLIDYDAYTGKLFSYSLLTIEDF